MDFDQALVFEFFRNDALRCYKFEWIAYRPPRTAQNRVHVFLSYTFDRLGQEIRLALAVGF